MKERGASACVYQMRLQYVCVCVSVMWGGGAGRQVAVDRSLCVYVCMRWDLSVCMWVVSKANGCFMSSCLIIKQDNNHFDWQFMGGLGGICELPQKHTRTHAHTHTHSLPKTPSPLINHSKLPFYHHTTNKTLKSIYKTWN